MDDSALATPLTEWRAGETEVDVAAVVIGSGYGGAVAARRLAESGAEVVVFERGNEYLPGHFPNDAATALKHLRAHTPRSKRLLGRPTGVFEWHLGLGMVALTGNGVGGGSLINAGVVIEPTPEVFEQASWPSALRPNPPAGPGMPLSAAFRLARQCLRADTWDPSQRPAKGQALARLHRASAPVDVTIDAATCTRCGDCATGCNHGAKRTLRDTYLEPACRRGALIVSGATARMISPRADGRWLIRLWPTDRVPQLLADGSGLVQAFERRVVAGQLIIAAGTFGSTELLQRSQAHDSTLQLSPMLGRRVSGNGDSLSFMSNEASPVNAFGAGAAPVLAKPCDLGIGPTITTMIDLRRDPAGGRLPLQDQVLLEDGAVPAALGGLTVEMLATSYLFRQLDRWRFELPAASGVDDPLAAQPLRQRTQVLLAMGHDGASGRLRWDATSDRPILRWRQAEQDPAYVRQDQLFGELERDNRTHLHPPTWQPLPKSAIAMMSSPRPTRSIVTVHPLGGCTMADSWAQGVVNDLGQVWRPDGTVWPNLRVLDGSIIPSSLGANPLLTITALAERSMEQMVTPAAVAASPAAKPRPASPRPVAFERRDPGSCVEWPHAIDASLTEKLGSSRLRGREKRFAHAVLNLEMGAADWLQMWRQGSHRVEARSGTLRLAARRRPAAGHEPAEVAYRVTEGWFELLPYRAAMPFARLYGAPAGWLWSIEEIGEWVRAFVTWIECRGGDEMVRAGRDWRPGRGEKTSVSLCELLVALGKGLAHAAERREMRYRLVLQLQAGDELPLPGLPSTLTLLGTKQVRYGAGWKALAIWPFRALWAALQGKGVPPPKRSFWDQVFNPSIVILPGDASPRREAIARRHPRLAGAWLHGRFRIDLASLLESAPLHLNTGDLTNGLQALAAYPLLFARHVIKTQLFDFRLPDYERTPRTDPTQGVMPLEVSGETIVPKRYTLTVPRGHSDADPVESLPDKLELTLWRYRPATRQHDSLRATTWGERTVWRARSVLLVHAFAQSGAMFTMPAPHPSLAAHLLAEDFDVWVLDHRISIRLEHVGLPSNMSQIARYDIPAAVDLMLGTLTREHAQLLDGQDDPKLQVLAFGQCIGGASLAMSLLDGSLSHGIALQASPGDAAPAPMLSKLAGAVISQTHPFLVGMPQTQAKTWVPAFIRDAVGLNAVPFSVNGPQRKLADAWLDRVLASMAVPEDEHCPRELDIGHRQDDCATCRRIRFIEAPLFRHANLLPETHAQLPFLFGPANVHLFAHAARCVANERLVEDEGGYVYVTDERMRKHFCLPLAFLHGARNELFHPTSAIRSGQQYSRLFPGLAFEVDRALGADCTRSAWIVPDHGHVDVVLGKHAPQKVFQPMVRLFETMLAGGPGDPCPAVVNPVTLRAPLAGPMLGQVRVASNGQLRLRVAFLIDDRFSDGKADPGGVPGTRTWAMVRTSGSPCEYHLLVIRRGRARKFRAGSSGYRIAHGELTISRPADGQAVELLAYTLHEAIVAQSQLPTLRPAEFQVPPAELVQAPLPSPKSSMAMPFAAPPLFSSWLDGLIQGRDESAQRGWADSQAVDPTVRNPSAQRREARGSELGTARLRPASIRAADSASSVEFFAACCRYPGWAFDRHRVDEAARRLIDLSEADGSELAFGLMLGDQIYADATAGIVDPLTSVERYFERYREAFGRKPRRAGASDDRGLGDLLSTLPVYLTPDDHEFRDAYPDGSAVDSRFSSRSYRGRRGRMVAADALKSFQAMHMPPGLGGRNYTFEHGPVRFFVLDTRTQRRPITQEGAYCPSLFRPETLEQLTQWLSLPVARSQLNCIASGSVILPRLAPGSDPSDGRDDSAAWSQADREKVLALLSSHCRDGARVLLLSGDYHLSAVSELRTTGGKQVLAAAVVAPPLYAPLPYANASISELDLAEDLSRWGLEQVPSYGGAVDGSGFARLRVERQGAGYRVRVSRWLQRHERHDWTGADSPDLVIELP